MTPVVFDMKAAAQLVPHPKRDAHKYSRGALAVIAGSAQFSGAAVLATKASARAGAGYTKLLTCADAARVAKMHLISEPVYALEQEGGSLCKEAVDACVEQLGRARAALVGPGLSQTEPAVAFLWNFLTCEQVRSLPLVLDADALNIIASDVERFVQLRPQGSVQVLTPHEGEAARLLGHAVEEREQAAHELAEKFDAVVVLKGPQTLIANPEGAICVCCNAGPELAKAGTGDVLAGMVGAFVAQGLDAFDASCLAVYLHGHAGHLAAQDYSDISVVASDLPNYIGLAIADVMKASEGSNGKDC